MSHYPGKVTIIFALWIIVVLSAGCATTSKQDLIKQNIVKVSRVDSNYATINAVNVHQHGGETEIEVVVQPKKRDRFFVSGDIQVDISDPNGNQFSFVQKIGNREKYESNISGSKLQHSHFWIRLPYIPSVGTTVKVTHIDKSGN